MNLPNYFFADLGSEAEVTPAIVTEACKTLKRNRDRYLAHRSTESLIHVVAELAKSWLDPEFPIRKAVMEHGCEATGLPEKTISAGLHNLFAQITRTNLEALILQEFGHMHRLDSFSATVFEEKAGRSAIARGPALLMHITGGVLPNPTIVSIIYGLMVRSAQFVKCASGTSFIPRMFAHSLYEVEPKLGACLEIAEWKGGRAELEHAIFAEADCVTATGSDETLEHIKAQLPRTMRFVEYGHRISFSYIARESLTNSKLRSLAEDAAQDVVAWNQLGCLSPHVIYVETGGTLSPEKFAEALAEELQLRERTEPRGNVGHLEAAAIAYRRSFYEVRSAGTSDTRLWQSVGSTAWTVIYDNDPRFQQSCLNRFIYVKGIADVTQAMHGADAVLGKVSTVGLAAPLHRAKALATELARWGVTRVCPIGQMQNPPLTWRHDGRPALADLVTWTDWES